MYAHTTLSHKEIRQCHAIQYGRAIPYLEKSDGCSLLNFSTLSLCMKLLTSQIQNQLKDKNSVIAPLLRNGCIFRFSQSSKMTTQEQNVTSFDYDWPISIHVVCLFFKIPHTETYFYIDHVKKLALHVIQIW